MVSQDSIIGRVFGRPDWQRGWHMPRTNVGNAERTVSTVAGLVLAILGLKRRSLGGLILAAIGGALVYRGMSGRCGVYSRLGIDTSGNEAEPEDYFDHGIHIDEAITIDKPPAELFRFWRNFENLPKFMNNLKSVEVQGEKRSHWIAAGPANKSVEWDAEIINEEKDQLIAWRTLADADIQHTGSVRFVRANGGRGTEVKVTMEYLPPAGRIGDALARLFRSAPDQEIRQDLRRLKHLMETGEIPEQLKPRRHGRPTPTDKSRTSSLKSSAGAVKDEVQEASEESFPASDPPGWGSTSAG